MSVASGPNVVTSGLVFDYDMNNTGRSWKGMPTTNLFPNPDMSNGNTGYNAYVSSTPVIATSSEVPPTYGVTSNVLECTSAAAAGGGGNSGGMSMGCPSTTAGITYTMSYYARSINNSSLTITFSCQNGSGDQNNLSHSNTITTSWVRYTRTVTLDIAKSTFYHWSNLNNAVWQLADLQLEATSFATPFVNGSRSTTQALLDLTQRSTTTVNSLVYNSDNTFQFIYSNPSTVQVPLATAFNKLEGTINVWIYPTSYNGGNGIFVNNNSTGANYGDWLWIGPYSGTFYFRLGDGSTCCNNDLTIGSYYSVVPANTWTNLCCTWSSGGTSCIYINGSLYTSRSISSIPSTSPSSVGLFGCGHANADSYYNGKMPMGQIYNRQLSAAEVAQNFNAIRSIYGI